VEPFAHSTCTAAATDHYRYDGYGNLLAAQGSTPNPYRFAGEEFESDLGLYNLRARWMSPANGRFLSRDSFDGFVPSDLAGLRPGAYRPSDLLHSC